MFNIFRMHMYRVSRAKSTIILSVLLICFLFFGIGIAYLIYDNPLNMSLGTLVGSSGVLMQYRATDAHQFLVQGNDAFLILTTIFAVIFTNCDFTRGFAKNTYSMFEKRRPLVFAKWSALISCVTGVYIVYSFLALALSAICVSTFTLGGWGAYFKSWIIVYICLVALVTMVFWITSLFKSPTGGMVIGILVATGIFTTAELILSFAIVKITGSEKFILAEYCMDYVFKMYNVDMGTADTVRTIVVALAYMTLALVMSVFLSDKKDVKI
jgi:hypothetical protein